MSSYRTVLPPVDPRRAAALRAQLRRLASALTPRWVQTRERDDFAFALLSIAARLGEETTRRLDQTSERDPVAFFAFLGLPPLPPRAATGVLAMQLADGVTVPVFAPARTQATVAVAGGDEAPFETSGELRVVPGRLAELIAVDPAADRIEQAPAQVTTPARPAPAPASYVVLNPAAAGGQSLQLSPAVGLAAADLLQIGTAAYRIETVDANTGIVTLLDKLEAPVAADTTVRKIASFPSFHLRDLQHHVFYVGHSTLFDLKEPATISLAVKPPHLARELTRLAVTYSMWGTREGDSEPAWQPLVVRGTHGGVLDLVKPDAGTVEKFKVDGRDGRWLRAELSGPVGRPRILTSPTAQISVAVASLERKGVVVPTEGSRTIARAFYNGTPLSTAGRFFPFGPEPLRFDAFALAAPEALTKTGATATVDITMVDSSLATLEIAAVGVSSTVRGYGVGRNGDLQALVFRPDGGLRWNVLQAADSDGKRLLLSNAGAVETATAGVDLVVAAAKDGKLYTARIRRSGGQEAPTVDGAWQKLPDPAPATGQPTNGRPPGPVLVPAPSGLGLAAVLFGVAQGALYALKVTDAGVAVGTEWQRVASTGATGAPTLTGSWQLTGVQGPDWPKRPNRMELVVIASGAVWLAGITPTTQPTATWQQLADDGSAVDDTAPAATRFRADKTSEQLWVAYAAADRQPGGVLLAGTDPPVPAPGDALAATVQQKTTLHANPGLLGVDDRPVTVALGDGGVIVWSDADDVTTTPPPPAATPTGRPLLLRTGQDRAPEVILGGTDERIFRAALAPNNVGYTLHDLVAPVSGKPPHWVEIGNAAVLVELGDANRRIVDVDDNLRIYQIDAPALQPGMPLTFLRYNPPTDPLYHGSFPHSDQRDKLQLDPNDGDTASDFRLIIDGAAYVVESVDAAGVASLESPVAGDEVTPAYRTAEPQPLLSSTVQDEHLGTLAELATTETVETLDFGSAVRPPQQRAQRQQRVGSRVWVQLAAAWGTRPPATGQVLLPGTVAAGSAWTESALERGYQNPELSWEYFDGEGWRRLEEGFVDGTANLSSTGKVSFTVPGDLSPTEIGGKTDYWIRARLIGGDYGRPRFVVRTEVHTDENVQSVTVDTSDMHPPEILAIEASFELDEERAPEVLLVENNLDVRDQTQAALVPEARFDLFQGAAAVTDGGRALFLGLTGPVGIGSLVVFVDVVDQEGDGELGVDLRTAAGWHPIAVDDRTTALRRRGMITLTIDVDTVPVRLFGQERVWLRMRADTVAWAPEVLGVYLNAVAISQARTVPNEILGSSLGEPGLTVTLAATPVLPDTVVLRVREPVSDEELAALRAGYDGPEQVVVTDPEKFPGSWVLWQRVGGLLGHPADARVYVLEPGSGRVSFGDGRDGKIPPAGRDGIRAFGYQQIVGEAGNVAAWSQAKLTSAVEGVDTVVLPVDAAGGVGGTDVAQVDQAARDSLLATAPDLLRHAGRALTPADVEALVVASGTDVVRAYCAPPTGPRKPITVTLSVRDGANRRPVPTLSRRDAVAALLRAKGWGGLGPDAIVVKEPTYVKVAVAVRLVAAPRAVLAGVEQSAKTALTGLFHPAEGGPDGTGWPFGRPATRSDVLRALGTVTGLDRVVSVELTPPDPRPPADGQVTAEPNDVTVVVTAAEERSP